MFAQNGMEKSLATFQCKECGSLYYEVVDECEECGGSDIDIDVYCWEGE